MMPSDALLSSLGDAWRPGVLRVAAEYRCDDPRDAARHLADHWPAPEGWICFTDEVIEVRGVLPRLDGRWCLSAELVQGGRTLHLRQEGSGLRLITLTADAGGDGYVEKTNLLHQDQHTFLQYEIGWERRPAAGLPATFAPVASRFVGFAPAK